MATMSPETSSGSRHRSDRHDDRDGDVTRGDVEPDAIDQLSAGVR